MQNVVITVRHPDESNHHEVFAVDGVYIVDVDLGSQFDGQAEDIEQWEEFRGAYETELADLRASGQDAAADYLVGVLEDARPKEESTR